jgi:serine protease Do
MSISHPLRAVFAALAAASLACGLGRPPEPTPAPTAVPEPSATPKPAIATPQDVEQATIQILAEGTFVDPAEGLRVNAVGAGSGFIIDPSGVAVTNNHVVAGAARLIIYLNGEEYSATILGRAECADLAVIQIDTGGERLPALEIYDGPIEVGMEVWSAGFPLGEPQFTLTSGIISRNAVRKESNWASVDDVFLHDAKVNSGNSGGPLVNVRGQVVGVNYAANSVTDQNFAIDIRRALEIVDDMRAGLDVDSIGINGQAVLSEDGTLSGIWVASVDSGSPADVAGVRPGDLITRLEGISVGRDGIMTDYCGVLASHADSAVLGIEVLRLTSQELWAGQINGRTMEATYSFANQLADVVAQSTANGGSPDLAYSNYQLVTDRTGQLRIAVPVEWGDISDQEFTLDNGQILPSIIASTNLGRFLDVAAEPGVWFAALGGIPGVAERRQAALDSAASLIAAECSELISHVDYEDAKYEGEYLIYRGCLGQQNVFILVVATSKDPSEGVFVFGLVNIMASRDLEAFQYLLNTFDFVAAGG